MIIKTVLITFLSLVFVSSYAAPKMTPPTPRLLFSDIVNGPDTGIGDGLGSGAIVTLWGQHLGEEPGDVYFIDSAGTQRKAAHVYYWKKADGNSPGGPANLYASHRIYEIAFSIPDSAAGDGEIHVSIKNNNVSISTNPLPFNVRSGDIYHIRTPENGGSDEGGNGSFASPWASINKARSTVNTGGAIMYLYDNLLTQSNNLYSDNSAENDNAVYWNSALTAGKNDLENQMAIISYPGSQAEMIGSSGITSFNNEAIVASKLHVKASNCDDDNGQPDCSNATGTLKSMAIQGTKNGRIVANALTDRPGGCVSGQQGALNSEATGGDRIGNLKMYGNEIYDYGCAGTSKFHHTTYLTVRNYSTSDGDGGWIANPVEPWEMAWNYLHDNEAKNGLHLHDQNTGAKPCGYPDGTIEIHDNVVIRQAGVGIYVGAGAQIQCEWPGDFHIYNNILADVGRLHSWDGSDPSTMNGPATAGMIFRPTGLSGKLKVFNNLVYLWNQDSDENASKSSCMTMTGNPSFHDSFLINWSENICVTNKDLPFESADFSLTELAEDSEGNNNIWFYTDDPESVSIPSWSTDNNIKTDPEVHQSESIFGIRISSSAIGQGIGDIVPLDYDIYGIARNTEREIGPIELFTKPLSPSGIQIVTQ